MKKEYLLLTEFPWDNLIWGDFAEHLGPGRVEATLSNGPRSMAPTRENSPMTRTVVAVGSGCRAAVEMAVLGKCQALVLITALPDRSVGTLQTPDLQSMEEQILESATLAQFESADALARGDVVRFAELLRRDCTAYLTPDHLDVVEAAARRAGTRLLAGRPSRHDGRAWEDSLPDLDIPIAFLTSPRAGVAARSVAIAEELASQCRCSRVEIWDYHTEFPWLEVASELASLVIGSSSVES